MTGTRLAGRVAVVTGAGRGLGRSYALALAGAGASVVVADLDGSAGEVAAEIAGRGGQAVAVAADVGDADAATGLVEQAVSRFGTLHVLVNNAGILRDRPFAEITADDLDAVIRVHVRGHFLTTQAAVRHWLAEDGDPSSRDACVIATTSTAGLHGSPGQANYSMAKAAIAAMPGLLAAELPAANRIRVHAIAPGARTRMTLGIPAAAEVVAAPADGRFDFFDPDNVAPFVVWLATRGCPAPSGTVFGVEGDLIRSYVPWAIANQLAAGRRWTPEAIDALAGEVGAAARQYGSAWDLIHETHDHIARSFPPTEVDA